MRDPIILFGDPGSAEAGELSPRDPVEGRGHRQVAPVEGKTANTPRLGPVSPRITRFRLAADLGRMGLDTHRVSNKVSKITSRHLVPLDRAFPAHALVHESELARNDPHPEAPHLPISYDSGPPRSVIRFRMLHASSASALCPPGVRARRPVPMIDLYLKKAFSTRACRW